MDAGANEQDNLAHVLRARHAALTHETLGLLRKVASLAEARGWCVYLVGGCVRDLILGRTHYDLDIAVEGDALALAADVQRKTNARLETTNRFGTAYVEFGGNLQNLDLVTARREEYPQPGALPVVQPGTIKDDLARRDVTINALAIQLRPEGPGPPLAPHGGVKDAADSLVR